MGNNCGKIERIDQLSSAECLDFSQNWSIKIPNKIFLGWYHFFLFSDEKSLKNVKNQQKWLKRAKKCAKLPGAGQNTQHFSLKGTKKTFFKFSKEMKAGCVK